MTPDGIYYAETEEEKTAVEELRFQRFVKELKICHPNANYKQHRLSLPDDDFAKLIYIQESKEVVACARLSYITHGQYSDQQHAIYSPTRLHPLADIEHAAIQDMVLVQQTDKVDYEERTVRLFRFALQSIAQLGVNLFFTACRDSECRLYQQMGFRPYREYYNSLEKGLLMPLVLLLADFKHLRFINSPLIGSYAMPQPELARVQHIIGQSLLPFP